MRITEKEKQVIINIAENEYTPLNGGVPKIFNQTGEVWADCIGAGPNNIPEPSIPGICGSLYKKRLIDGSGVKQMGRDAVIYLTKRGFDFYKEIKNDPSFFGGLEFISH